ncbi:FkbM family methyltransferase [Candidatus Roizmanbacteria bacterium CG_4_10_14_0_8_um_filter_39_9]|uniref:FkbM family methyltransferase n=1 Tax=Candidatus Roizmanbacteria bacterium CG_4_10_14_0_8_um_filter_39_9 TaxID=1974829 RepID=A0A2M7QDC3_9BACT|nr:MAG: FkbM family methyltransferase [Candidatus Roizmanbacteria bacterium CG_4_10_14_0_8_um_filter_39_9]
MIKQFLLFILYCYQYIFARKIFYPVFKLIYQLSLRGLGILNYQNSYITGEQYLISRLSQYYSGNHVTVFDVGANKGDYIKDIRRYFSNTTIHAFEPNHKLLSVLIKYKDKKTNIISQGLSDRKSKMTLYDVADNSGSEHASLYKEVISIYHKKKIRTISVNINTIDAYCKENGIPSVQILKIDTEGNELKVLYGAKAMLNKHMIDFIQFEFNSMNVYSGVFFKMIYNYLDNYWLYRLLPDGLISLREYNSINTEIYAFQNIIAVRKNILFK